MKLSVSQLNRYVKNGFDADPILNGVTVCGEISGLKYHSSGHIYFTLKDEGAAIRCAFFKPHSFSLKFRLEEGMSVLASGRVSLYEKEGQYQLNVVSVEKNGVGDLFKEFERLKKKLEDEGLFDSEHKKTIPKFSKKIGVVTSPTGAVFHDIINVATRRCPKIQIVLAPVSVQGDDAPRSICAGLDALEKMSDIDVIIVGRGGGSMEDLWCFNSELVARKIFSMTKPVISAVGHETDFTIADFVADMRAPTPSAAAELAVLDYQKTISYIDEFKRCIYQHAIAKLNRKQAYLSQLSHSFKDPESILLSFLQRLDFACEKMELKLNTTYDSSQKRLAQLSVQLDALSPLKVLSRGYSVTMNEQGRAIKSSKEVKEGENIKVRLEKGALSAKITEVIS